MSGNVKVTGGLRKEVLLFGHRIRYTPLIILMKVNRFFLEVENVYTQQH